jgi:hypothetical protein
MTKKDIQKISIYTTNDNIVGVAVLDREYLSGDMEDADFGLRKEKVSEFPLSGTILHSDKKLKKNLMGYPRGTYYPVEKLKEIFDFLGDGYVTISIKRNGEHPIRVAKVDLDGKKEELVFFLAPKTRQKGEP